MRPAPAHISAWRLTEASPQDSVWDMDLRANDGCASIPDTYLGQNVLV